MTSATSDRIYVGFDASPDSRAALRWAAGHAADTSSDLSIVCAHGPLAVRPEARLEAALRAAAEEEAEGRVRHAARIATERQVTLKVHHTIHNRSAVELLLETSGRAALTVLGTGRFSRPWPFSLRSTAAKVLRVAAGPIAIVPSAEELAHNPEGPIVLGIDIANLHLGAVRTALRLARRSGREVEAVYVWDLDQLVHGTHLSAADLVLHGSFEVNRVAEQMLAPISADFRRCFGRRPRWLAQARPIAQQRTQRTNQSLARAHLFGASGHRAVTRASAEPRGVGMGTLDG